MCSIAVTPVDDERQLALLLGHGDDAPPVGPTSLPNVSLPYTSFRRRLLVQSADPFNERTIGPEARLERWVEQHHSASSAAAYPAHEANAPSEVDPWRSP